MNGILLIAQNTFREAIRQKLILLVGLIALLLVFASKYLLKLDLGHEQLRFVFDFGSGALDFFGAIIAIVATCQLFHSELENKTVITLLSKPVGRLGFVFGKFVGTAAVLALFSLIIAAATCLMLFITYLGFGEAAERLSAGLETNYAGVFAYAFMQWLKLCAIAALAAFICSLSRSLLFSVIISFMALSASMMVAASDWLGAKANLGTQIAVIAFPDFQVFRVAEIFAFAPVSAQVMLVGTAYSAIYVATFCLLGAWVFSRREF